MPQAQTDLHLLQQKIGVTFQNTTLLTQALIHRSSLNENRQTFPKSNERLEYLGDAVLEQWVSTLIFHQFPQLSEGELTNLRSMIVRTESLASISATLGLGDFLYLSKGEETHGGRQNISILADSLEALIGAIYLDQGQATTDLFLQKIFQASIDQLSQKNEYKDPKSLFQEVAQAKEGITPQYQILSETGPDHDKTFTAAVFVGSRQIATGTGNSKQKAEETAAGAAILCYNPSYAKNQT